MKRFTSSLVVLAALVFSSPKMAYSAAPPVPLVKDPCKGLNANNCPTDKRCWWKLNKPNNYMAGNCTVNKITKECECFYNDPFIADENEGTVEFTLPLPALPYDPCKDPKNTSCPVGTFCLHEVDRQLVPGVCRSIEDF